MKIQSFLIIFSILILKTKNHSLNKKHLKYPIQNITEINDLKYFVENNKKVIILFSSNWCHFCKKVKPIYKKVSLEYKNINFVKVNIDHSEELMDFFNVERIPFFIGFQNSKKINVKKNAVGVSILNFLLNSLD